MFVSHIFEYFKNITLGMAHVWTDAHLGMGQNDRTNAGNYPEGSEL